MGIWEVVGFVLICWWSISTIVKNHRYFRALKKENIFGGNHGKNHPDS
jgi:hypothetical protein